MEQYVEFVGNHPLLFAFLVAVIALIIFTEIRRFTLGFKSVSPTEAVQLINHEDTLVLDVREDGEVRQGTIGGAKHIPLAHLQKRLQELDKHRDKPVIAYCRSGNRSVSACNILRKHEFAEVYNLSGGIMAWESANLPLKKR